MQILYRPMLHSIRNFLSFIKVLAYTLLILSNERMYTALADPSYVNATIKYDSLDGNAGRSAFLSVEFIQLFSWHVSMNNDITLKRNLTVTEAFLGTNIAVDIERTIFDESCEVQVCSVCKGSKFVQAKSKDFFDPILIQTIIAPCPACVGLGIVTYNGCNTFKIVKEHINVPFHTQVDTRVEMLH